MDRADALKLIDQTVKTDVLRRHLRSVEAVMRAFARRVGEDEERWGLAGLLHDFDWEAVPSPAEHPHYGAEILRQHGWPEDIIRAVLTHGDHTGITRESLMEKALYACDELTGFVIACALVRPSKSLSELTPQSVRKKMKDKAFARSVNREDITRGAAELGVDLDEHIAFVTEALKPVAQELGLNP